MWSTLHVTGTRSLLLLQQIQTSPVSWNVYLHTAEEQAMYNPTAAMSSSVHSNPPGRAAEAGTAPSVHPGTQTKSQQFCGALPHGTAVSSAALWHKGTSSLPQGAELGPCPQGLGSTYRRLSLRVAMAACRASSFTASQPGGGPFWSSSFTASTAPSMVPTAALYCSSEGGWQALLATGCRLKQTWNINLILLLRDQSSSKCKKALRWSRAARVPCPVRVLAAWQALQTIKISYKGPGVHVTFLLRTGGQQEQLSFSDSPELTEMNSLKNHTYLSCWLQFSIHFQNLCTPGNPFLLQALCPCFSCLFHLPCLGRKPQER